jgi:hypothetical protein
VPAMAAVIHKNVVPNSNRPSANTLLNVHITPPLKSGRAAWGLPARRCRTGMSRGTWRHNGLSEMRSVRWNCHPSRAMRGSQRPWL